MKTNQPPNGTCPHCEKQVSFKYPDSLRDKAAYIVSRPAMLIASIFMKEGRRVVCENCHQSSYMCPHCGSADLYAICIVKCRACGKRFTFSNERFIHS